MKPIREQYYRAWRLARVEDRMVYPFADVVLEPRRGAVRVGPNGRRYAALVINQAFQNATTGTDRAKNIAREKGALRWVRDARTWNTWATLPA